MPRRLPDNRISVSFGAFYGSLVSSDEASPAPLSVMEQLLADGLGLEIWFPDSAAEGRALLDDMAVRELAQTAEPLTAHTRVFGRWAPDELLAEVAAAAELGVRNLVVHPSSLGWDVPDFSGIRHVCRRAHDVGVTLALENVPTGMPPLRQALDETGLGICVDIGHANLSYMKDGVPPVDFLKEFRDAIVEVHVHDNDGQNDMHAPPGEGTLVWEGLLAAISSLPQTAVVCMELSWPHDPWGALRRTHSMLRSRLAT